jgi:hypothetical protein
MKRPTYREAIKELSTIAKGLQWMIARSTGPDRRKLTLRKKAVLVLVSDFNQKEDKDWKLDSFDDPDFESQDYDFNRYKKQVSLRLEDQKSKKRAINNIGYKERKSGRDLGRKALTVVKRIFKEYGIKPKNLKEVMEGTGDWELEFELTPTDLNKKSRISEASLRKQRIKALQARLRKYAPLSNFIIDKLGKS